MPVDDIAATEWRRNRRPAGLVEHRACMLLAMTAAAVPADQTIVECGAYRGRSTGWLLVGADRGHRPQVHTIDPWCRADGAGDPDPAGGDMFADPDAYTAFLTHMAAVGGDGDRLTVHRARAVDVAANWTGGPVGLLWHDAGHTANEVADDLSAWLPHLADTATIMIHDACSARRGYGVVDGAARTLADSRFDWSGRQIIPWPARPTRRGVLIVRGRR